jgi:hypothetical protein
VQRVSWSNSTGIEALNFGTGGTGAKTVVVGSTASTSSTTLQSGTGNLSIQTQGTGTLGIGNNAVAQVVQVGNNTGATSISILSGTGGINFNGSTIVTSTNTFSTGTGAVTIQGAATVSANLTTTNAANIAFQKGADFSTVGTTPNANLGTGVLIRLTGVSAQTITGISNGVDGRVLTLVNAAGQAAIISNLSGGAGNQVSTGTGGDLTLPAGATVSLAYDAGANLWRVIGGGAATGGYIQLQGATPGTQQTGNFNISGIGIASTGFDAAVSGTLNLGTTNASAVNIATNATAHTVGIGTDTTTVQTIAIGSTNGTSSLSLQAGTGSLSVQTQGGTLGIANNSVAQAIVMGNTTGTSSVTVFCGTGSCTFGAGATAHTTTVGTTNTTSTTTLQGGTGGVNIGTGGVSNVIQIGSTTGSTTQTINIGNNAISGSSDSVVIGSTIAGNITLQSAATISIGNNAAAQTINIGNTTGATGILASVGSGNFSLDGATNSTYTLGASTTTGTISIGGTTQTGAITLGNSTAAGILNIANGSGATAVNIANLQNAGSVSIGAAMTTGTISIGGTGAQTGTIAIGTGTGAQNLTFGTGGTAAKILTIGSTASTSSLLLQSGTGNLSIQTQGTGTLGIGNNAVAQTIQVGNNTGATSVTLQSGTGALNIQTQGTGGLNIGNNAVAQVITIGNTTGATGIVERVGTANYSLDGVGSSTYTLGASTTTGTIAIGGTAQTGAITIGNSTGIEALNFGTGGTGAKTVVVGSTASTSSTTLQSGTGNILFTTNNITRGTFDTANNFYFGNGVSAAAPNNFVIQGTGSTTTAVAGGAITLQGGNATVGSANGGNLTLAGGSGFGTGVGGLVVLSTPTFQTASTQTCSSNCTITQANEDGNGAVVINVTVAAVTVTMPDPTTTTAGRIVYVTAALGSNDFTLAVNGGGTGNTIAMRQNTTATMIWNGSDWTAAGASSSTTLQSAYDNTLTSAGGAELVVSNTANHNGLTIRDSSTLPVNATLLEVQTSTAASLFSVNGTVTDYANNGGAEVAFGTEWAGVNSGIATRNTIGTYVANGTGSVKVATTAANTGAKNVLTAALTANLTYNVSFAARLDSTSVGSFTDLNVIYSVDGTASSAACTNYSTQTVPTSVWAKINCTFTVPSSGITSNNAVFIRQTLAATRSFYVDNFSVTVSANLSYATDGGVDNAANFTTNWTAVSGSTVTRSTTVGNDTSDSAQVVTTGTGQGIRNKLSINPFTSTLYRITVYSASTTSGFNSFNITYSRDGGTNFVNCADYNTPTISSATTSFTEVTCYITTDGTVPTNPYVYFTQTDATGRTFYIDTFSMNISTNAVPNVQIGGGLYGGPVTLFTLDRGASAPIAANNDSLLGSMYYDTTLGKLQCYESSGWGACGSSPDNIITISPEYTNAVLHGTGVGTMNSDICSGTLHINDGTSSQPTICASNETYNFYKWTSPQASAQTYSIYVTYQLPNTFKSFTSSQTTLKGRTDSTNATVQYSVYRNNTGTGLTQCGTAVAVSTGSVASWQTGLATGAADPSTCSFSASDSIVFKIDVIASSNANAYVGNLGFTFSNK